MNEESRVGSNREYRYTFRLSEEENARFLALFEQSGAHTKTRFILGMLFDREFRVVKTDIEKHKFYMKLCDYYRQFRGLANNYNQTTKAIHRAFDERRARYLLRNLRTDTAHLGEVLGRVLQLTEEFKQLWLSEKGR